MRPARQVKVISSQLENLECLKKQLENVINEIEKIMTQGQTWIDEADTVQSFTEISHFLTSETFNCTQKCLDIANEDKDLSELNSNTECDNSGSSYISSPGKINDNIKDDINVKLVEIDKWRTKHSTALVNIKQKFKRQEKQNEIISSQWIEKDKKTNLQFEEIMKELQAASDFMSKLQSQTEMLTDLENEHEKKIDKLILELKVQEVKISNMAENHISSLEIREAVRKDIEKGLTVTVQSLKKDIDTVSSEFISFTASNDKTLQEYRDSNNVFQENIELQVSSELDVLMKDITRLKNVNISSKKVSFTVGLMKSRLIQYYSIVEYDKTITNIGDCYNSSTGIFTCPMDGLYLFYVSLMPENNSIASVGLYQNTDIIMSVHSPYEDEAGSHSNMVTIHLKQNDEVCVRSDCVDEMHLYGHDRTLYSTFTGFLLSTD